ncbi:MAG: O-antigen ligase family protein [Endomicrobium sp.]|jgi:O-antigen ligase|nr:O-antigen ligase family protein [Endomicrobium sp.]
MLKILTIAMSLLLALGLFSDKYLPFLKEATIGVLFLYVLVTPKHFSTLVDKIKEAFPLFAISIILFIFGAFFPYHIDGESVINIKFLVSIVFFVIFSTFFSIHPKYIQTSLVAFGIGAGILSMLFTLGFLGESMYEIRNDRLILLGENPNSLSVRISLGILFLVWGAIENRLKLSKFYRVLLLLPIPFMFNLILFSGSKGSFLLCVGSVTLYILLLKNVSKAIKRAIVFFGIIIVFFALSFFFQSTLYERFLTSDLTSDRSNIWENALEIFIEHPIGIGEVGYKVEIYQRVGTIIDTHNLFIYLLVTGGGLALLLFVYFLYNIFIKNLRQYKKEKNIIYLLMFFSMVFVMSKTGGVLSYLIMWYFFACINGEPIKKRII